jgi:hypothetical protein
MTPWALRLLASCGFRETYGPFGAVAGRSFSATLALTSCQPDPGVETDVDALDIHIHTKPRIDWGDGGGFQPDNVDVNSRGDCIAGCRMGGSHTYSQAGTYTVQLKYFVFAVPADTTTLTVYVDPAPPTPTESTAGWMGALHSSIGDLPLSEIVIPATHDSGTAGFTRDSVVAPDFPNTIAGAISSLSGKIHNATGSCSLDPSGVCADLLNSLTGLFDNGGSHFVTGGQLNGVYGTIGDSTAGLAIAQDTTILQQLNGGVRLLDIRLCVNTGSTDLRFCHSLYGGPINGVLPDIKSFIQSHPTELVILDIHRTVGLDGQANSASSEGLHEQLIQNLRSTFSTDGTCAAVASCLLVSNSFTTASTLNQILATPGRVIVFDGDSTVVTWDKDHYPNNPVLWDEGAETGSTFVDGLTSFDGFRSNMLNDLDCRCNSSSSDRTPVLGKLFPLGMTVSPDNNLVESLLLLRLLDNGLGHSIGPAIASAILGSSYDALGSDVADGPGLQQMAAIENPLTLDSLYGAVVSDPNKRFGANWLSTDFFESSDLVPIAIALNKIAPTHFTARPLVLDGSANPPVYTLGAWSTHPVDVHFDCVRSDGTVVRDVDVETVGRDTPTDGTFVQPIPDCYASPSHPELLVPVLRVSPIRVDMTPPVVTVLGVSDGGSYTYGDVPQAVCRTIDATSGVQVNATLTLTQLTGAPAHTGTYRASCAGATDVAGNSAATVTANYTVQPVPLSITAKDASRVFGDPNPACQVSGDGFVSPDILASLSGTLSCAFSATTSSPVGDYTITPSGLTSPDYSISFHTGTLHVIIKPTSLSVSSPNPVQYSDQATLTATVGGYSAGATVGGGSVAFTVNGATVCGGAGQPACPTPNGSGVATLTYAELVLGPSGTPYAVSAAYIPANSNFSGSGPSSPPAGLTVTAEDARVTYIGPTVVWTASPTSTTTTVQLMATLRDISVVSGDPATDAFPGDIRTATLRFVDRANGNALLCAPTLALVNPADSKTATATCSYSVSLGSQSGLSLHVGFVAGGNYARDAAADDTTVSVAKPRGGATVVALGSLHCGQPAGALVPASGGVTAAITLTGAYSAGAPAPTGNLMLQLAVGNKRYTVVASRLSMVGESGRQGVVQGSVTILDTTTALRPVTVDGAASVQVTLTATGPNTGTLAFSVLRADGSLALACGWDGAQPVEQQLTGTIVVS